MIEAASFVEAARVRGFSKYAGVPCSFLTPFINYVIQDESLSYVSAANEGDAVALTAGLGLNGERGVTMMQNSGLGNAVSPLTSLTWTFCLPQLLIVTWRGEPGVADEPQHALMGPITPRALDLMEIAWELFPATAEAIEPALERACAHMDATGRPYALLMKKGSVASFALRGVAAQADQGGTAHLAGSVAITSTPSTSSATPSGHPLAGLHGRPTRTAALARVIEATPLNNTVVLASTGFAGRELYALDDRPNHLYMVGSMGCIAMLGLGLALARPDLRVVAIDGDGSALMRMSVFATVGRYGPPNLCHLVLDNGVHDSTGGQATVSNSVSFAGIAAACGYEDVREGTDLSLIDQVLSAPGKQGARFARILISPGSPHDLPRPVITPVQVKHRLAAHIGGQPRSGAA